MSVGLIYVSIELVPSIFVSPPIVDIAKIPSQSVFV